MRFLIVYHMESRMPKSETSVLLRGEIIECGAYALARFAEDFGNAAAEVGFVLMDGADGENRNLVGIHRVERLRRLQAVVPRHLNIQRERNRQFGGLVLSCDADR